MKFVATLALLFVLSGCAAVPQPAPEKAAQRPVQTTGQTMGPIDAPEKAVLTVPAAPPAPAELAAGFGGLPWGSPLALAPGLALSSETTTLHARTYAMPGQPLVFLGRPVTKILYEYFEDAFYHVWIEFQGRDAYQAFLADLIAAYGAPDDANPQKNYNAWFMESLNLYCAYHDDDGTGDVSFWHQPVYRKKEALVKKVKAEMRAAEETAATAQ